MAKKRKRQGTLGTAQARVLMREGAKERKEFLKRRKKAGKKGFGRK